MSPRRLPAQATLPGVPKPVKRTEGDVLREVRAHLRERGWLVLRMSAGIGSHRGLSDLIACREGRVVFLEVKKPTTGRLSEAQQAFRDDITAHGCEYRVATCTEDLAVAGMVERACACPVPCDDCTCT